MRYVIWRDAEVAELADAHGSGPCDSNIMRVQVPSSARRLKSKDLSLFLVSHQQSRDAAVPKGPRASSGFRQSHLSLHTLPFPSLIPPIHSTGGSPGTDAPGGGSLEEPSRNPVKRPRPEARRRVTPTTMNLSPKNAKNLPGRSLHRKGFFYSHRLIKPVLFLLTQQALQSPLRRW